MPQKPVRKGPINSKPPGNGFGPNKHQAINLINNDARHWRVYTFHNVNILKPMSFKRIFNYCFWLNDGCTASQS